MNILVANHRLIRLGGSETFTYTLIGELLNLGFNVEYFCNEKGNLSDKIEEDYKISFSSRKQYDLILANHWTTVDLLYKKGPVIQTCHGVFPSLEQPSRNAFGYVAISKEVQKHLLIKGFNSWIIYNGVNCERFKPNKPLRKTKPKVLSLCQHIEAHDVVKEACKIINFDFGILDKYDDNQWNVEDEINKYDIVVGLGRSAYEAMACGRPVIFFDKRTYAGPIGIGDGYFLNVILESIKNNCSGRAMKKEYDSEALSKELLRYHRNDGKIARGYALSSFNVKNTVQEYLEYYKNLQTFKNQNSTASRFKRLFSSLKLAAKKEIKHYVE